MDVLFVCRHNVFRSRIAEAYFNKITNSSIASSAGIIPAFGWDMSKIIPIAKEFDLELKLDASPLSLDLVSKQDVIFIVADDVEPDIFDSDYVKAAVVHWDIEDNPDSDNPQKMREIISDIINRIDDWCSSLSGILRGMEVFS